MFGDDGSEDAARVEEFDVVVEDDGLLTAGAVGADEQHSGRAFVERLLDVIGKYNTDDSAGDGK